MISADQALALRRAALLGSGLAATLLAHAACAGGMTPTRVAPALWGSFACIAVVLGRRRAAPWREWSPAGTLARLLVVECSLHAALTLSPWAFGVAVHHSPPLIGIPTVAAHALGAAVLGVWLLQAQRILGTVIALARRLRRALTPRRARAGWAPSYARRREGAQQAPRSRLGAARAPPRAVG